ncbi:hypothetical protein LTR62_000486 [Meristemomyces frigidus]|uniref:Zn(2)-C6 fungal-type domain-containing protein n=1 Tax=Meristemomyces frigidus TaxID=1508187 RepID=A0AAN7TP06_9PEZI|nr:hypothetical protein LTR62_000486 [Meristemomyces frigidus]
MDQQLSLSGYPHASSSTSSGLGALGLNEQACNECKRRKGRCDRQLPECGPCARNRRHCLYEKHSKTPLTRKYLTAVEERLRQAEIRTRQLEKRALVAEAKLQAIEQGGRVTAERQSSQVGLQFAISEDGEAGSSETIEGLADTQHGLNSFSSSTQAVNHGLQRTFSNTTGSTDWQYAASERTSANVEQTSPILDDGLASNDPLIRTHDFEVPPSETDDFSWDEQSPGDRRDSNQQQTLTSIDDEERLSVVDGMASLSVEDRGTGYLGVASGAAMLRLLLPDADHRGIASRRSPAQQYARSRGASEPLAVSEVAHGWIPTPVFLERNIGGVDMDSAITAYFSLYHLQYPIVHEASFRAQYAQVIPRPAGKSWNALAYMVAAIGLFTTSAGPVTRDLDLFEAAKANISIESLESGNLTLVQVLILMSNYLQKRNKPNSGYNYIGVALHMAMGLGLHKEFHNWSISPLTMEIRRRVWWCVQVFAIGAIITFGRPLSWPDRGVEVALPLNIDDRDLTNVSTSLPMAREGFTTYSAVAIQARFHMATNEIYSKIISVHFPRAAELIRLDDEKIETWRSTWLKDDMEVPHRYRLSRSIMEWRYRNFRIIMYRPFVVRFVLQQLTENSGLTFDQAMLTAVERCLTEARITIASIHDYWSTSAHNCLGSWYGLYFLFQASLIPVMCLRNNPMSGQAPSWRQQIMMVLSVFDAMHHINPSSRECYNMIARLCAGFLDPAQTLSGGPGSDPSTDSVWQQPVQESPQTQLSGVYSMMWPLPHPVGPDIVMPDDVWTNFLTQVPSHPSTHDGSSNFFWNQLEPENQNEWPQ